MTRSSYAAPWTGLPAFDALIRPRRPRIACTRRSNQACHEPRRSKRPIPRPRLWPVTRATATLSPPGALKPFNFMNLGRFRDKTLTNIACGLCSVLHGPLHNLLSASERRDLNAWPAAASSVAPTSRSPRYGHIFSSTSIFNFYTECEESACSPACFVDVSGVMLGNGLVLCMDLFGCADFGRARNLSPSPLPPPVYRVVLHRVVL